MINSEQQDKNFTILCEQIILHNKFIIHREYKFIDFAITHENNKDKTAVLIKLYKSMNISLVILNIAIERLVTESAKNSLKKCLLIVSIEMTSEQKQEFEDYYKITIWDRSTLYYLCRTNPTIKANLDNFFNNTFINPPELTFDHESEIDSVINDYTATENKTFELKGELLCKQLDEIVPGSEWKKYELKCTEILKYIFSSDLTGWKTQNRTDDSLHQFDLICRINSKNDYWNTLVNDFHSKYILFEFKNYTKPISQKEIYSTEKYLFKTALRSVAFIISPKPASLSAHKATRGILRESGKIIFFLTSNDLCEMLRIKDIGKDPSDFLFDKLDNLLLSLSK